MSLNQQQYSTLKALLVGILPTTETPSAVEVGVDSIMAYIFSSWPTFRQASFANSLDVVNNYCLALFDVGCDQINQESSLLLVQHIAQEEALSPFWVPFRTLAVLIYYGDHNIAHSIGMPGPSIDQGGFTADGERVGA
ncbi:gluconate 2-dehydrogenase subunit 3 family protein [Thalassotalea fusca]